MDPRKFNKVKGLRSSLERLTGIYSAKQRGNNQAISMSPPSPVPPVIKTALPVWEKFVNISVIVLCVSLGALVLTVSFSNPPDVQKASEAITTVVIRILFVAGVLGWTASGLIKKRKRVGLFVFSTIGAVSIFAFSVYLLSAIVGSKHRKVNDRAWAASTQNGMNKFMSQVQQGSVGDGTLIEKTGDPSNDELSKAMNKFMADLGNLIVGMRGEAEALQPKQIFDDAIISDSTTLDAETQKRMQSLQIVERYRQKMAEIPGRVLSAIAEMKVPDEDRQSAIRGFNTSWNAQQPQFVRLFELLKAQQQTELDYLRFMAAWTGRYKLQDHKITFSTAEGAERCSVLTKNITTTDDMLASFRADERKKAQEGEESLSRIGK